MGVKQFCINIEGMPFDQVDEIIDKYLAAGGNLSEGVEWRGDYIYFGLDYELDTYFWNIIVNYAEEDEDVPELTIDQLDEHLGLVKPTQKETIMTNEITDMKNTAILLEGLDEDTIQAYIKMCGDYLGQPIHIKGCLKTQEYLEFSDVGEGLMLYATSFLEESTKLITIEKCTTYTYTAILPERKTVTLFGTEYYEDMLAPMLSAMEEAKVPDITPSAGSGNPPIKKAL